jgi:hypothetical protein
MTCFNKADSMFRGGFNNPMFQGRSYQDVLREESQRRCRALLPFDLVTIEEDSYKPRVFTIFDTNLYTVPPDNDRQRANLITPKEIKAWIEGYMSNNSIIPLIGNNEVNRSVVGGEIIDGNEPPRQRRRLI